jgi:hypothetical protein
MEYACTPSDHHEDLRRAARSCDHPCVAVFRVRISLGLKPLSMENESDKRQKEAEQREAKKAEQEKEAKAAELAERVKA